MNYYAKKTAVQCIISISLLAFTTCNTVIPDDGGTQTGNPALAGVVYNQDGTRAANAKVRIARWNADPQAGNVIADSTVSNDTGGYAIDSLITDTFNLLASSGVFLGYEDSITVKSDSTTLAPPCTLKATGSVTGVVQLQQGDNATTVLILFMGTNIIHTIDNAAGNFTIPDLAEGHYRVHIFTTLDEYLPKDVILTVTAGIDDTLPAPIVLDYTGIPVPQGLRIEYDTMMQIVKLYWNTPTTGRPMQSYNVYRRNIDSNTVLARINASPVTDTTFTDSTGMQDMTYEYQVAVVDTSASEGVKSVGVAINFLSAYVLVDSVGTGLFQGYQVLKISQSGQIYVADIEGSSWKMYVFDSTLSLIRTIDSPTVRYPGSFDLDSAGNIFLINLDGVFKLDSACIILDTISTWNNAENKTLRLYNGSVFIASGEVRKYTTDGTLFDSTSLIGADGLTILRDTVFVGGLNAQLRLLDTSLVALGSWQVAFKENEIAWGLAKDEQNNIFILGYNSNPDVFTILFYDSNRNYKGKMSIESLSRIEVRNDKLFLSSLTSTGQIKVYQLR